MAWMPATMMTRLRTIARTGRRMNRSVSFMLRSAVVGVRCELRRGLLRVVDRDRGVVTKLEGASGHDLLALLQAVTDRDEVATPVADANELLACDLDWLAV